MNKFKVGDVVECITMPTDGGEGLFFTPGDGREYIVMESLERRADETIRLSEPRCLEIDSSFCTSYAWGSHNFTLSRKAQEKQVKEKTEYLRVLSENKRLIEI